MKKIKKDVAFRMSADEREVLKDGRTKRITAKDLGFRKQMKAADDLIERYRNTFRELAK